MYSTVGTSLGIGTTNKQMALGLPWPFLAGLYLHCIADELASHDGEGHAGLGIPANGGGVTTVQVGTGKYIPIYVHTSTHGNRAESLQSASIQRRRCGGGRWCLTP